MTTADEVARWWGTSVSRIEPGVIELRGRPVQELIGSASLVSVIWLLLRGSRPAPAEEALLEAALVVVRRPRPAGAVHRRGPDGRDLRGGPQHGDGDRGRHAR